MPYIKAEHYASIERRYATLLNCVNFYASEKTWTEDGKAKWQYDPFADETVTPEFDRGEDARAALRDVRTDFNRAYNMEPQP